MSEERTQVHERSVALRQIEDAAAWIGMARAVLPIEWLADAETNERMLRSALAQLRGSTLDKAVAYVDDCDGEFTAGDLAEALVLSPQAANNYLARFLREGRVARRRHDRERGGFFFVYRAAGK